MVLNKLTNAWRSWTIWFNGVILAAMPFISNISAAIQDNLPAVQGYLTADVVKNVAIFVLVANIALRFKTTTALQYK